MSRTDTDDIERRARASYHNDRAILIVAGLSLALLIGVTNRSKEAFDDNH